MENIIMGFSLVLTPQNILFILIGTVAGYFIGAMPGLTPTIGLALLIPFTYSMQPVPAIIMLVALYMASNYGGGITAILVNTPGTPAAAATALDGYPLAREGKAALALGMSIMASGIGALVSTLLMIAFALPLATVALKFGPPEYFALAIFGLSVVAGLSSDNMLKGLTVVALGMFTTTIGMDPITGSFRFTPSYHFLEGLPFVPAMIGLFAISEIFVMITDTAEYNKIEKIDGKMPGLKEIKDTGPAWIKGTLIGFFVGMLPAAGANVACWVAYNEAKRGSKTPELFGKGSLEGIASAESANNASVSGALVPLLTMGIPGSSATAVLIGALTLHGMQAGPLLFEKNPEIPYSVFASLLFATPIMVAIGLLGVGVFAKVTLVPKNVLATLILGTCILGAYALSGSMFGIWIAVVFGILGYFLKLLKFPIPPLVLAMVLGRMAESNYRLTMLMGSGNFSVFFTRPLCLVIVVLTVILFTAPLIQAQMKKRKEAAAQ